MTALQSNVKYDEFVIASADADFTPLLQVVRAEDRMITVIATLSTAAAYESLADRVLDEQDIFKLIAPDAPKNTEIATAHTFSEPENPSPKNPPAETKKTVGSQYEKFKIAVRQIYSKSKTPMNLSTLASEIRATSGIGTIDGKWFGARSFVRALQILELPNAQFSNHYLWDPSRHSPPAPKPARKNAGKTAVGLPPSVPATVTRSVPATAPPSVPVTAPPSLPDHVLHFAKATGMPKMASNNWPFVYQTLAAYAAVDSFNPSELAKWSRDQAVAAGRGIARHVFSFVIHACHIGGTGLYTDPSPDAVDISRALFISVLQRAELAGLEVNESAKRDLAMWLHCGVPESEERMTTVVAGHHSS